MIVAGGCGEIPDSSLTGLTGSPTEVVNYGFSIAVDTSLVDAGWGVREYAYTPTQTERYRSLRIPLVYELFVDRPSFNGRGFQPLDQAGERVERGRLATRIILRVLEYPQGVSTFDALVDTIRNLNQLVTDVSLNGHLGKELSRSNGDGNNPDIYSWSHTEEMVPRMIFRGSRYLYFVNTFESRGGNNPDTSQVASVLQSLQIAR